MKEFVLTLDDFSYERGLSRVPDGDKLLATLARVLGECGVSAKIVFNIDGVRVTRQSHGVLSTEVIDELLRNPAVIERIRCDYISHTEVARDCIKCAREHEETIASLGVSLDRLIVDRRRLTTSASLDYLPKKRVEELIKQCKEEQEKWRKSTVDGSARVSETYRIKAEAYEDLLRR